MASMKGDAAASNMSVDYVIIYKFENVDKSIALSQFKRLLQTLSSIGMATTVRAGAGSTVLIFVKIASESQLRAQAYHSRVKDWLHGVRTAAPDSETQQSLDKEPLHEAERLRIIYQMMTSPKKDGGAHITPRSGEWENVDAIFPLHDHEGNKRWLTGWAKKYTLAVEDLDEIRNRLGEKVAFYFAFTQAYFTALLLIATFGASCWFLLGNFSSLFAIGNSFLCVLFVEYWKRQEYDLAIRWGVSGVRNIETRRHDFQPEKQITDPVTGEKVEFFPAPKRIRRQLLQIPFALLAAVSLCSLITAAFAIEIFISEVYQGPGKSFLTFLPTIILTTMQPPLLSFLTDIAKRLTTFENYETQDAWDKAMIQKIFVLNFVTSYLGICLSAFVYVPFGDILIPYLDVFNVVGQKLGAIKSQTRGPSAKSYHIKPDRLKKQVIYFTVTAQIVNQLTEVVVPYLKRRGLLKVKELQAARAEKHGGAAPDVAENDLPEEAAFLKRVRGEVDLETYDVTTDYREMVVQYGYLSLFSVVWPLTAVSFLVNNWIELRTDAAKICIESRRPVPWRGDGIGPWLDSLAFLTWVGSISTAAIAYMFSEGSNGPDGRPSEIVVWKLLLYIFLSEHSYLGVRWLVQTFMSKLDSPGRQKERRAKFDVRKQYLQETHAEPSAILTDDATSSGLDQPNRQSLEDEARKRSSQASTPQDKFWSRQQGWQESATVGAGFIEGLAREDSKKVQ